MARQTTLKFIQLLPASHPLQSLGQKNLAKCEQGLLALDRKLAAVLQGQVQPEGALEQLALADLCRRDKKLYTAAVKFYAAGLPDQPALARLYRYHAACAAALAASAQGKDAGQLDAKEKAKLRQQALDWLRQELESRQREGKGDPLAAKELAKQLAHWQSDPDLAGVRDPKLLSQFPDVERRAWEAFWTDIEILLEKAVGPG
jgi:hypothetical protein